MLLPFLGALLATVATMVGVSALARYRHVTDPSRTLDPGEATHWSRTVPVLGGHEPSTHAWNRFHARYAPMTLVLLAFEMEMMFMYPWAVVYRSLGAMALIEMGVFLAFLSLGVLYAWREGAFSWQ